MATLGCKRQTGLASAILGGWLLLAAAASAHADWAGFGRFGAVAEVRIEARAVHLTLRMIDRALPRWSRWAASDEPGDPVERIATRLLSLRDETGRALPGRLVAVRRGEPAENPAISAIPPTAAEPYHEAEVDYVLPEGTAALTMSPPAGAAALDIGLVALHRGVPVNDLAPVGKPVTLRLDRRDPWRSRFDDAAFVRRHSEPRSFLYVEPYEVRHEILIRLRDLPLDLRAGKPGFIEGAEREPLRQAIARYLLSHNPLRIDGAPATPQLDRVEFVRFGRQGVEAVAESEPLDGTTALAGVILLYLTDRPAHGLELKWETFGQTDGPHPVSVQFGNESFDTYATRRQPEAQWSADETLSAPEPVDTPPAAEAPAPWPAAALFCLRSVGAAIALAAFFRLFQRSRPRMQGTAAESALLLALAGCVAFYPEIDSVSDAAEAPGDVDEAAKAELPALLHNVYRAFQVRGEEAAYDRLAVSVSGGILEEIYLRQRRALLARDGGLGGEARVNRIDLLDSRVARKTEAGVEIAARWVAHGTVSHWGHSHERSNEYRALLVLSRADDGRWKITGLEFLDPRRNLSPAS